jgi:cation diffusion facilitator family transporter
MSSSYSRKQRMQLVLRTVMLLAIANAVMSLGQIVVGIYGYSDALVADGLHTFLDLLMDGVTYFACQAASRPPDQAHPYGYRRIETLACLLLSVLLAVVGFGIVYEALIYQVTHAVRSDLVILISTITMVLNELLYRYASATADTVQSDLLAASASHQRSDAFSSLIVLLSAVFDLLLPNFHFDGIAAVIIGFFIIRMGYRIAYKGVRELIDGGIESDRLQALERYILSCAGVVGVHELRTRKQAGDVYIDAHIITEPFISVSEGHFIGDQMRRSVMRKFKEIVDVVVHIDAEDDTYLHDIGSKLPSRRTVQRMITPILESFDCQYDALILHYHDEVLFVELHLAEAIGVRQGKRLLTSMSAAFSECAYPTRFKLYSRVV